MMFTAFWLKRLADGAVPPANRQNQQPPAAGAGYGMQPGPAAAPPAAVPEQAPPQQTSNTPAFRIPIHQAAATSTTGLSSPNAAPVTPFSVYLCYIYFSSLKFFL